MSDKAMLVLGEASESDDEDVQPEVNHAPAQCYGIINNIMIRCRMAITMAAKIS